MEKAGKSMSEYEIWDLWMKIQETRPVVHCITNIVTVNDCANILLAAGASPTMAHDPREVAEVTRGCQSLVCNMGAMESLDAMEEAGVQASNMGHPIILDPVGVAGSSWRRRKCFELIRKIKPNCIRGNFSEIKALAFDQQVGIGVDASEGDNISASSLEDVKAVVRSLAQKLGTIVVASGVLDVISDGEETYVVSQGSSWMARITGSGCMSSALLGAFLSVECSIQAAAASCVVMGICGEIAEAKTRVLKGGTGTFHIQLLDAVSLVEFEQLKNKYIKTPAD